MAKQRYINTKFWADSFIQELDINTKYLYLYLLTNSHTEISGIYELTLKTMSNETGIDIDKLSISLDKLSIAYKVKYFDNYIFIVNFIKHQNIANPKIKQGITRAIELLPDKIKDSLCIDYDSLSISYGYPIDNLSHLNSNSNSNTNINSNTEVPF